MDAEEKKIIVNALGLGHAKKPYRNHFWACAIGPSHDRCERLAANGLMLRGSGESPGGALYCFYVTEAGAASVGHALPAN
jgi:hypothetical protein